MTQSERNGDVFVRQVDWEAPFWSTDFKEADRLCGGPKIPASWLSIPYNPLPLRVGRIYDTS